MDARAYRVAECAHPTAPSWRPETPIGGHGITYAESRSKSAIAGLRIENAGLPMTTESDVKVQSGKRDSKAEPRGRAWTDPTVVVAVFALLVSAVTGVYAYSQVKVAREQATASEQQQLVTLVISIAQLNEQSGSVTSPLSVSIGNRSEEVVDGQAAVILINELPPADVSTTEYVQVGKALADGGDFRTAISYFSKVRFSP